MSFWDDLGRVGAAVATGGMSEAVLAAAGGSPAPSPAPPPPSGGFGGVLGGIGNAFGGVGSMKPLVPDAKCCRYDLKPPFLVDNQTGAVWRYDDADRKFVKVEFELHPVAKSFVNLVSAKVAIDLRTKLQSEHVYQNRAQIESLKPFVDDQIRAIDAHLESLRQS
jgi:hypothetical protein